MNYFSFTDDINSFYSNSDLIICHSGAGTVYRLLELGKKVLIVPNLDRREDHQLELCKFVETNNFGLVAYNLNDLEKLIKRALFFKTRVYSKDEELLLAKDINRLIMKYYNR
jgi:beta-1,4-N-acetylglucosaminyltransferase